MKHCPRCREEYEDVVETCANCDAILALGPAPPLPPPAPDPLAAHGETVSVATTQSEAAARFLEGLLRSENIPTEIRKHGSETLGPYSGMPLIYFDLMVQQGFVEHARALVAAVRAREPLADVTWAPDHLAEAATAIDIGTSNPSGESGMPTLFRLLLPLIVCAAFGGLLARMLDDASVPRHGPSMREGISRFEFTVFGILIGAGIGLTLAIIWLRTRSVRRRQLFGDA